jgi:hypothetical protein
MGGTNERGLLIRGFGVSEILVSLATIRTTEVFDHLVTAPRLKTDRRAPPNWVRSAEFASRPLPRFHWVASTTIHFSQKPAQAAGPGRSVPLDADLEGQANA